MPEPICMISGALQRRFVLNTSLNYVDQIYNTKWRHLATKSTTRQQMKRGHCIRLPTSSEQPHQFSYILTCQCWLASFSSSAQYEVAPPGERQQLVLPLLKTKSGFLKPSYFLTSVQTLCRSTVQT